MRVYSAPILAQVAHVKHVLEMNGIECRIQGEHRSGAAGELPLGETWAELWVLDPSQVEDAKRLVREALDPAEAAPPEWTCPSCREVVDGQFAVCWNCGASGPDQSGSSSES